MDFSNRIALVTGSSSGIGHATTLSLLNLNCTVFGLDIHPPPASSPLSTSASTSNSNPNPETPSSSSLISRFTFHQTSLLSTPSITSAVSACLSAHGKIDILLNIAGIMDSFTAAGTVSDAELDRVLGVNLLAPIRLMREVIPHMVQRGKGGSVVNVLSRAATTGATAGVTYTASKHGLLGATKHTAFRYRGDGIRVNGVAPGGVATNIVQNSELAGWDAESFAVYKPFMDLAKSSAETETQTMPPEDIANAIIFLASDKARNINGVVLPVDQGWSAI